MTDIINHIGKLVINDSLNKPRIEMYEGSGMTGEGERGGGQVHGLYVHQLETGATS